MFLFARVLPGFRQHWIISVGVRAQKSPKNGYFMNAESVRETLEIFNLTTTNALTDETSHDKLSS